MAISVLVDAGLPVAAASVGGVIGALGAARRQAAALVVYFAAGAFLGVALLDLLPEAAGRAGWAVALGTAAAGWLGCALLARWAGGFCPACMLGGENQTPLSLRVGAPLLIVISLHCGLDGLAMAGASAVPTGGSLLVLAVLAHKLPEGMAIAAVARTTGLSAFASFGTSLLIECWTFVGLLGGIAVGAYGGPAVGAGLGLVAGSFLYLVALTFGGGHESAPSRAGLGMAATGALLVVIARVAFGAAG